MLITPAFLHITSSAFPFPLLHESQRVVTARSGYWGAAVGCTQWVHAYSL